MPKKKGGGSRKAAETPEEKAMRLEMERIKAIEDEIHRAGAGSLLQSKRGGPEESMSPAVPCLPRRGCACARA